MAQKWPKIAQKLAPAEKIAQIYLQHLQLFASLPAPRTAFITRRALLRSGGACPDPFVPASWQCLYHGTLPPSLSCELAGRGKVLMTNNLPSPVGQAMLADSSSVSLPTLSSTWIVHLLVNFLIYLLVHYCTRWKYHWLSSKGCLQTPRSSPPLPPGSSTSLSTSSSTSSSTTTCSWPTIYPRLSGRACLQTPHLRDHSLPWFLSDPPDRCCLIFCPEIFLPVIRRKQLGV